MNGEHKEPNGGVSTFIADFFRLGHGESLDRDATFLRIGGRPLMA